MIQKYKNPFLLLCLVFFNSSILAQIKPVVVSDSLQVNDSLRSLPYKFNNSQSGRLFLNLPSVRDIVFDKDTERYVIVDKIGNTLVKTPLFLSTREYQDHRLKKDIKDYYKQKIGAFNLNRRGGSADQKDLLPTYYVKSSLFKTIFGGNTIEMNTQGSIDFKMGVLYQNIENPQLSEDNRKSFSFDFDQQVTASIAAKIGERLKISANYDTKTTFDFQNMVKVEFIPAFSSSKISEATSKASQLKDLSDGYSSEDEDDIIKKIELGNISMNVSNNLISGAQSLFGLKTQLQFGKTTVTSVFSQQKSEIKTVQAEGGATLNEFELQTTQYEANKHFFLAHYFRNQYKEALKQFPLINSPINIVNLEVWVTNRSNNSTNIRNIVALTDLGESGTDVYDSNTSNISNTTLTDEGLSIYPNNSSNNLEAVFVEGGPIREIGTVQTSFPTGTTMVQGTDYSIVENAKKLNSNEYTYHPQLGILSLKRPLNDGDVLAVAFQYTVTTSEGEKVYKVGNLSTDGILSDKNIVLKLLRSEITQPGTRIWDLMMKNVYSLGAYQMQSEGFRLDLLYKDDQTGVSLNTLQNANTEGIATKTLLNLVSLDVLDQNDFVKEEGDGYFDYIEGITVKSETGTIIFPTVEPFGRDLEAQLDSEDATAFVFNELYTTTQTTAKNNYQNKDKYLLKGYYKSDASSGISLGAFNVPRGSVKVTSNGILLSEGADYVVDYMGGSVQIINPAIEASGAPVQVSLENNTLFSQQTKRYVGIDVAHKFSDKFQMTGTYLNVNEKPITQKIVFGSDPINNTMLGLSVNYDSEVPFLTKLVNKLPFQDTDVPSQVSVRGDIAYLKPGTPKGIDLGGEATVYVDDFEGSQIPISLMDVNSWKLSSKPLNFTDSDNVYYNLGTDDSNNLGNGKQRAKMAWYSIDRLFYGGSSLKPSNIDNAELSRAEVSRVEYSELFPETDLDITQTTTLATFDLSYFPSERGSYNYDTDVDNGGKLNYPENRWGGITRGLTTTDFERANVEYIEFWMQDPYENYSIKPAEGGPLNGGPIEEGALFFNLGNVSEDVLKDGRKVYENGLPESGEQDDNTEETEWSRIPNNTSFLYAFNEVDADRLVQDVGLDGLGDAAEEIKFPGINAEDPSSDNYRFFRGSQYDQEQASIISRYKDYNNTEGNSLTAGLSQESYPTSSTSVPDSEDVNKDQTMNTIDAYYQYKVSLNSSDLVLGKNNIVDVKTVFRETAVGGTQEVTWYQFRIPIRSGEAIGSITDFNSIRFMRMFLTKFKTPVVLRFGKLQLVRGDWRRYDKNAHGGLQVAEDNLDTDALKNFTTGVVNIEENESRAPIPYVLPPGIVREQLQGSTSIQFQNEQSLSVRVKDLEPDQVRTVYKNTLTDLRMFKRLKLFLHAEGISTDLADDQLMAILRIGSDLNENFYQIELPLKATSFGTSTPEGVWPEENNLEVDLESLSKLKVARYKDAGISFTEMYPLPLENEELKHRIRVKGNPNLSNIKMIMMGVKNISEVNQSGEIWFNELRASGLDNQGGWATVINADANFADLADVALTGRIQTMGFGNVEQRVNERSQKEMKQYGVATNVNIGQLMPKKWGINIPMSYSVSEAFKDPKYDPQFQDVLFKDAKNINENSKNTRDYTKQKNISFINVRKNRTGDSKRLPMPYDIENFSLSYSYNEEFHKDYNVQKNLSQDVKSSVNYAFSFPSKYIEPFKNSDLFKNSKYFKIIKDFNFNLLPTSIGVNSNIIRNYNEQLSRNLVSGLSELPTLKQRNFLFDWDYTIAYNVTKALKLNFRAANKHIYDSFESDERLVDDKIALFSNFFNIGRADNYSQKLKATYKIPIDKLPFMSFVSADYTYSADFDWQAGSQSYIAQVGNAIQNANTHNVSSNFNMLKFYREIGLEKLFNPKKKRVNKKDTKGNELKFAKPTKRSVGKSKEKKTTKEKILKATYNLLTSLKTIRMSYSENNGTELPGYVPSVGFLGRDKTSGGLAPSLGFVFGNQADIRQMALENKWLVIRNIDSSNPNDEAKNEPYYSKIFAQTHYNKLDASISVKPINDLDISISANRIYTKNKSQQFDPHFDSATESQDLGLGQLAEVGNFSMSYNMLNTAFDGDGTATFEKFIDNINTIDERLPSDTRYSQEVLLPAFTSAYSGNNPSSESLNPFRNIPLPNWRVTYKGLMKMKWFKKNFSSFSLSHRYKSSYTISNYTNDIENPSKILISNVSLVDGFSPLVKLEIKLKNSLSFRGEITKDRTIALNFNNNTLSDARGTEYVFGLGYRVKGLKIRGVNSGRREEIKGNLNIKADVAYRQNLTTIRTIDTENSQITGGQDIFTLKMSADYNLSKNLIATFYYDQTASKYAISTSFPRSSISSGLGITYNLGN